MKNVIVIFLALGLALTGAAQGDYVEDWNPDADGDGNVGVTDLLALLSVFSENDADGDGIWDSVDDCIGVYDPCGVCNGTGEDNDEDGLCDDVDDCVGAYDECGECNGPGPNFPVIDEILYETDSVFIEVLGEWYVFEYATDTLFTYVCPVSGCTDDTASNYDPEAVIEDGSCTYGPLECGGTSTVTFDGYTYALVVINNQCWFAENLRTEHYANGDAIPGDLSDEEWSTATTGAQAFFDDWPSYLDTYGRVYNWYALDDVRGLCPSGWHVPTEGEFTELINSLGGPSIAGESLKSSPSDSPSWDGTNTSGFSALPGGSRWVGFWNNVGHSGDFWTASADDTGAWAEAVASQEPGVFWVYPVDKRGGLSVRCVRD